MSFDMLQAAVAARRAWRESEHDDMGLSMAATQAEEDFIRCDELERLHDALAASQAHAKALREALPDLLRRAHNAGWANCSGDDWETNDSLLAEIEALPADTSALDAELAKESVREAAVAAKARCAEAVAAVRSAADPNPWRNSTDDEIADEILRQLAEKEARP